MNTKIELIARIVRFNEDGPEELAKVTVPIQPGFASATDPNDANEWAVSEGDVLAEAEKALTEQATAVSWRHVFETLLRVAKTEGVVAAELASAKDVFYVDVGDLPPEEAPAYLKNVRDVLKLRADEILFAYRQR